MTQVMPNTGRSPQNVRVPEWVYYFTDEQFILWCKQRKLQICTEARAFPDEERAAIFRYMVRQQLVS